MLTVLLFNGSGGDVITPEVPSLVIVAELLIALDPPTLTLELDTVD